MTESTGAGGMPAVAIVRTARLFASGLEARAPATVEAVDRR